MSLDIRIDFDSSIAEELLGRLSYKQIAKITQRSMNTTIVSLRQKAIDETRKKVKVREGVLRKKYTWIERARGNNLHGMEAVLNFSSHPLPLLEFVKGSKNVIAQKGIPIKKRRKLKFEITPGKVFKQAGAFIQRGPKSKQVFKRTDAGRFKKQGTPSIGEIVVERGITERLRVIGAARLQSAFNKELQAILKGYTT